MPADDNVSMLFMLTFRNNDVFVQSISGYGQRRFMDTHRHILSIF